MHWTGGWSEVRNEARVAARWKASGAARSKAPDRARYKAGGAVAAVRMRSWNGRRGAASDAGGT
ncbi:hypothetical protein ACFQZU_18265, partial [Streptomonospora algeriensis]